MTQLPIFEPVFWNVTDLTRYLHSLLLNDEVLQDVWVQGEVSNFSRPTSGHLYFTLKDSSSSLKCVMWRSSVVRQNFLPRDGEAIEAHGSIGIYEAGGVYQLYADTLRRAGEGLLYQEFLRLKARLEAEGLFDSERKRPIPHWPHCIGIVTSPTGAALRDMLNILQRRYPLIEVILAPTAVQGDQAPVEIVAALELVNQQFHPDIILLARGGGSIEDLWAFNDERVARAIAASTAPVISGIGHETDFTIADFVSDLRAPTPTAAAELATPNRFDLDIAVQEKLQRLERATGVVLNTKRWSLDRLEHRLNIHSPHAFIRSDRQRVDELARRAAVASEHHLALEKMRTRGLIQHLVSLNPLAVLQRGYAIVSTVNGVLVTSATQVQCGDELNVQLKKGTVGVFVKDSQQD